MAKPISAPHNGSVNPLNYAERNAVRNETLREVAEMVRDFSSTGADPDISGAVLRGRQQALHAVAASIEGMARK